LANTGKIRACVTPITIPKGGNTDDENEDAFYPARALERVGGVLRFAVSDGAHGGCIEWTVG
jgi:hypothetical protein